MEGGGCARRRSSRHGGRGLKAAADREARVARWYALTRERLPAMAVEHAWPIRLDHCFMRVCLDAALGAPWTARIGRPAVHTMSDAHFDAALAVAERVAREPATLPALNAASLRRRAAARGARAA